MCDLKLHELCPEEEKKHELCHNNKALLQLCPDILQQGSVQQLLSSQIFATRASYSARVTTFSFPPVFANAPLGKPQP